MTELPLGWPRRLGPLPESEQDGRPLQLLTLQLATFDFVKSVFGTFKWVVTIIVGFYFAADAAEGITKKVQEERTRRRVHDVEIAKARAQESVAQAQIVAERHR